MRIYKIKVNGKTYKVELEAIEEKKTNNLAHEEPSKDKTPLETKKEENKPVAEVIAGVKEVVAPIQGVVNEVLVKPGQHIVKGETVVIVEAMKLENEVSTPYEGIVVEVLVTKGQSVSNKQVMLKVK